MSYGHQYIYKTFNKYIIKTGWNVDSFGSSIVDSYIKEHLGF